MMIVLLMVAAIAAPLFEVVPAHARKVSRQRVAPGVIHRVIRHRGVPRVVHVVVADVSGPVALKVGLGAGRLPGAEPTSAIGRRHRAVAAINGDFFRPSGRPVGAFASQGALVQTPLAWAANIAFGGGGRSAFIGHQDVDVELVARSTGLARRVAKVNTGRPYGSEVRLYTRYGGRVAPAPRSACSARLIRTGSFTMHPATSEVTANYRVKHVSCRWKRMSLHRGIVLAARRRGEGADFIRNLRSDRAQRLGWSLGWSRVVETLGGNPVLVRDGEIAWNNVQGTHPIFNRHPRTGVGLRKDGKVLFVTVDGRQRRSTGMTLLAFAKLMKSLGARWALNLDGGGSTTMVVRGRVVNRPSDGYQRAVGSALMLVPDHRAQFGVQMAEPAPSPEPSDDGLPIVQTSIDDAQRDPASMGGLASWLRSEGRPLAPGLRRVARGFDLATRLARINR